MGNLCQCQKFFLTHLFQIQAVAYYPTVAFIVHSVRFFQFLLLIFLFFEIGAENEMISARARPSIIKPWPAERPRQG